MEGEFIIKRDRFLEEDDYLKEVGITINNLLIERFRILHIDTKDLNPNFNKKYDVGKDTYLPYSDFNRKLDVYKILGIRVLDVEYLANQVRILIPMRTPSYSRQIGEEGTENFIPSTIAFIRDFQPKSGYKK